MNRNDAIGAIFLIAGTILLGLTSIAISISGFIIALNSTVPYIVAVVFIIIGFAILLLNNRNR
ncbi:hypothetical protein [Pallidibacillus pasinlerensis]|uniref:Uncharacterized protein n=1 Tax=Pallidibacillus pasinlerensis TaxID=2703818 RepID=A0ABX0A389_9BACI|nr:hypothetical protein [Pallidibacillus pasinlerensis]NCU17862.1 hypothetical protein [Pallidibacillus pasinlerensis]